MKYKISLNKDHPKYELFKAGLSFRSADGKLKDKNGLPYFTLKEKETVISSDVPNTVTSDKRFTVVEMKEAE